MPYTTHDLGQMFGAALQNLSDNRQQLNDLGGPQGRHGDNMVHNLGLIQTALQSQKGQSPAAALLNAAQTLTAQGRGDSSQHYAEGLRKAAQQVQGKTNLESGDVAGIVQTLLGSVPASQAAATQSSPSNLPPAHPPHVKPVLGANPPASQSGDDLFGNLTNMLGGAQSAPSQPSAQTPTGGSILDLLGGLAAGGSAPAQNSGGNASGLDLGNLLNAGMAFMQAEQSGADTGQAALRALQAGLSGNNPMQSGSPRAAAGGLIAQTILGMLSGNK